VVIYIRKMLKIACFFLLSFYSLQLSCCCPKKLPRFDKQTITTGWVDMWIVEQRRVIVNYGFEHQFRMDYPVFAVQAVPCSILSVAVYGKPAFAFLASDADTKIHVSKVM